MATKASKYKEMSPAELQKEEGEIRTQIWKLQLQRSTGQLQDPNKLRGAKQELARLLTARRARELESERATAPGTE